MKAFSWAFRVVHRVELLVAWGGTEE